MKAIYNIAYAFDHNYIFICAVSMLSVMLSASNTDGKYEFHLLIDDSVTEEDKKLFYSIVNRYPQCHVSYYLIKDSFLDELDCSYTYLNKMTLYRLMLAELLPNVDECLYLDSDTLIWDDLKEVFNIELGNNLVAGVLDSFVINESGYIPEGLPDINGYINAGVLMLNLKQIRNEGVQKEFLKLISNKYLYNDQDIINICCYQRIAYLQDKYNCFSFLETSDKVVTHFVSQFGTRPWDYIYAKYTDEWWKCASFFEETKYYKNCLKLAKKRYESEKFLRLVNDCSLDKKIYMWGSGKYGKKLLKCLRNLHSIHIEAIIDNDDSKIGDNIEGVKIIGPEEFPINTNTFIIISNQNKDNVDAICKQLKKMGVVEKQYYCYRAKPHYILRSVDPKYKDKFADELWMEYESGV